MASSQDPSCPTVTARACWNAPAATCNSGGNYPWSLAKLETSGTNAVVTFVPTYLVVYPANTAGTVTFTETFSFPAGWGAYLTASGFSGAFPSSASAPSVVLGGSTTTATTATVTWSFPYSYDSCSCGSPTITFTIPLTELTTTAHLITETSNKVTTTVTDPTGVPTCSTATGNTMTAGVVGNGSTTATFDTASSTGYCKTTTGIWSDGQQQPANPSCGGN